MEPVKRPLSVHFETDEDNENNSNNAPISPRKDSVTEILEQTPKLESDTEIKKKCVLGICCMDAKGKSKSMKNILQRLAPFPELHIVFFGEKTIFEKEVEDWPEVDCLLAFFSTGFPLEKAIKYQQLHPTTYCFNDLSWQAVLLDRRMVYDILKKNSIPTVKHVTMSRDGYEETPTFYEARDFIEVNGKRIYKPFVEKPVDSEDHNVYIYYHSRQGGGSTRLFRKIGNKSSSFHPDVNNVRRTGSFIYEEFIATDNRQDIKVYTLGIDSALAEARKAPAVDGVVERGPDGKELRETVQLSEEEVTVVRKVVKAFKQQFCGFDVLRKNGRSFVCDVNGWSFVKNNDKYFDDLAEVTRDLCLQALKSKGLPFVKVEEGVRHLKGVVAVFRHADRTPKQKVKLKMSNSMFLSFFQDGTSEIKIKNERGNPQIPYLRDEIKKLLDASDKVIQGVDEADYNKIQLIYFVLQRGFGGTKIQLKPIKTEVVDGVEKVTKALLICKWGGVLTHAGIRQSEVLGRTFYERVLPPDPSDKEEFCKRAEFFSNNERRVHKTAKEFAKGLLRLDTVTNDVVQDNKATAKLLGDIAAGKELMNKIKQQLFEVLHMENPSAVYNYPGLDEIGNPVETMREMHALMKELYHDIHPSAELCEKETIPMMEQRWKRLTHLFYDIKARTFDTTKIPDVFDYITYDAVHNQSALKDNDLSRLFEKAEKLARFVVPEEYGLEPKDKLYIGSLICEPLVKKLYSDLLELTKTLDVGCKFYFSSESHLHTLRNVLLHSNSTIFHELVEPVELSYLTHIVFKLWEHLDVPAEDPRRFRIEVLFSSGTHNYPFDVFNQEHRQAVRPMVSVNDNLSLDEFEEILQTVDAVCKKLNAEKTKSQEE